MIEDGGGTIARAFFFVRLDKLDVILVDLL